MSEQKSRIFIGSSTPNLEAARQLASGLANRNFMPLTWDENLLRQNESIFDGLLRLAKEVDFAVFVWGPSDITISGGLQIPEVRDNVVFETGLFMGALGKDRTFLVADHSVALKIPSDFNGIYRIFYDGSDLKSSYGRAAVSTVCTEIQHNIARLEASSPSARLQGAWSLHFSPDPIPDRLATGYDVSILSTPSGIHIAATSDEFRFAGHGFVHGDDLIVGEWTYPPNWPTPRGSFILSVNMIADAMYGYCTTRDAHGRTVFGTWVFGKNDGAEQQLAARLRRAEQLLQESTVISALNTTAVSSPGADPLHRHQSADFMIATLSPTQHKLFFFVLEQQREDGILESEIRAGCPIPYISESKKLTRRSSTSNLPGSESEYYYRLRELLHLGLLSMEKVERFENRWKVRTASEPALQEWVAAHNPKKRQ